MATTPTSPATGTGSLSSATTGQAIPLCYGYVWASGYRAQYYMLENTGSDHLDYTRVGMWLLGHGEWDGVIEIWDKSLGRLLWQGDNPAPDNFHFHRGCDTPIDASLTPSSSGPDQNVDSYFEYFPPAINPLAYHRIAYYSIFLKQLINNAPNNHDTDPTVWADIDPIGLFRSMRVRIFDADGNQIGYAFSTNPAWQYVDLKCRRKLFPEYSIDINNGPDPLPPEVLARFDWAEIANSASYYDEILSNGRRRFESNLSFSQQTSLTACEELLFLTCRSFERERAGQYALLCDQPRARVFTFSRQHIIPESVSFNDQSLSKQGNRYIPSFRDLLIPAAANIASITCPDHGDPTVTTQQPHPFNQGDYVAIGGTGTAYDGQWQVASVPASASGLGTDITSMTLTSKGSNFPANIGSGGSMGLVFSRFKNRTPDCFGHHQNQYARGAVGLNIVRQRERVKQNLDFDVSTFDQVARICLYERDRSMGFDQVPYVTPKVGTFRAPLFAVGPEGNPVIGIEPGDRIYLDDTATYQYTGDYEVLQITKSPHRVSGNSIAKAPDSSSGFATISVGPYDEGYMYDEVDELSAGWFNVPGSDPGNNANFTGIDLDDGGVIAFFSGAADSGSTVPVPSSGFSLSNLFLWAGPGGYIDYNHPMHIVELCEVDPTSLLATLTYEDGGDNTWPGPLNYAGLIWRSATAVVSAIGAMSWLLTTLAGGEEIAWGHGIVAGDGSVTIELPDGFTWDQALAICFPHDGATNPNDAHGYSCSVVNGVPKVVFADGEGHTWSENVAVNVFAWKNNMGTMTVTQVSGGSWVTTTLSSGLTFGVCLQQLADGASFEMPFSNMPATSLQVITSPSSFTDTGHPAHGVASCYIDGSLVAHMTWEDGVDADIWTGDLQAFGVIYDTGQETTTTTTDNADGTTTTVSTTSYVAPSGSPSSSVPNLGSSSTRPAVY